MRVIAGTARGRKLAAPNGHQTRPTPDRVREALFSILVEEVPGARVLDLFAGTGALGIEALSRGAAAATFVEKNHATAALLRDNLRVLGNASAQVIVRPVAAAVEQLAAPFDLVFMDPPFDAGLLDETLSVVARCHLLRRGGVAVCEHRAACGPPAQPVGFSLISTRRWGDVAATLLMYGWAEDGEVAVDPETGAEP